MYLDTSKDALLFLLCLLSILQEKCSKGFPLKGAFHKTKKIITILDKYQQQGTCNNKIPIIISFFQRNAYKENKNATVMAIQLFAVIYCMQGPIPILDT